MKRKLVTLLMILALLVAMVPSFAATPAEKTVKFTYAWGNIKNPKLVAELAKTPVSVAKSADLLSAGLSDLSYEGYVDLISHKYAVRTGKAPVDHQTIMAFLNITEEAFGINLDAEKFMATSTFNGWVYGIKMKDYEAFCKAKGWDLKVAKLDWASLQYYVIEQFSKNASDPNGYGCSLKDIRKFTATAAECGVKDREEDGWKNTVVVRDFFYDIINFEYYKTENWEPELMEMELDTLDSVMTVAYEYMMTRQELYYDGAEIENYVDILPATYQYLRDSYEN